LSLQIIVGYGYEDPLGFPACLSRKQQSRPSDQIRSRLHTSTGTALSNFESISHPDEFIMISFEYEPDSAVRIKEENDEQYMHQLVFPPVPVTGPEHIYIFEERKNDSGLEYDHIVWLVVQLLCGI
jgi:hypothetical protein